MDEITCEICGVNLHNTIELFCQNCLPLNETTAAATIPAVAITSTAATTSAWLHYLQAQRECDECNIQIRQQQYGLLNENTVIICIL
jgi:hypothetical protein